MRGPPPLIDLVREALRRDRLVVEGQPIVALSTGNVVAEELLIRIASPQGLIRPDAFLPTAEEHGLMGLIDRHVVDRAARLAASGRAVNVNVSAASVADNGFVEGVVAAVRRYDAEATQMTFEITASAAALDLMQAHRTFTRLSRLGFRVAVQDFGIGFGSFRYLLAMPVTTVKLDGDFVRSLTTTPWAVQVMRGVVALGDVLELRTVATGVEDSATFALLKELGVRYAQGYYIAPPRAIQSD